MTTGPHGPAIVDTLAALNVAASVSSVSTGPSFVRYMLTPASGTRANRIVRARDDIAIACGVDSVRLDVCASGVAVEVPRADPQLVPLAQVMAQADWPRSPIAFALGVDVGGRAIAADLARMPHLLIAGATGTGKSVALNALLVSMLQRTGPDRLRLVLIDAKRVELAPYAGIAHLWRPIATETAEAESVLADLLGLMERRYTLLTRHGARSVGDLARPLPRYVCIVDELADLVMASKVVRDQLIRLAQKSRAAGIHLVLATQRPSSDVISGLLKANVPARIALAVSSGVDSRVILDTGGAEDLLGRGDMLYAPPWQLEPTRLQGCFVSDDEIRSTVALWPVPTIAPEAPRMATSGRRLATRVLLLAAAWAGVWVFVASQQ